WHEASWDPDGRRLAVDSPDLGQVVILDPDAPEKRTAYGTHPWLVTVTLSPDGRWEAGGTWQGDGVKGWDRRSGKGGAGVPGGRGGGERAVPAWPSARKAAGCSSAARGTSAPSTPIPGSRGGCCRGTGSSGCRASWPSAGTASGWPSPGS